MSLFLGELLVLGQDLCWAVCTCWGSLGTVLFEGCCVVASKLQPLHWPSLGSTGLRTCQFSAFRYHPHVLDLPCHHLWPKLLFSIAISPIFFIVRNYKANWVKRDAFWVSMAKLDVLLQKWISESSQNAGIFYTWSSVCFHAVSSDNRVYSGLSQTGLI